MDRGILRSAAVALAVGLAVMTPGVTMGLHLGLDQAAFAAQGDTTLRAAPYAFAIWGPIYLGLIAYAAYQWRRQAPAVATFAWPSALAALGCAAWIVTTALNWQALSLLVILTATAAAAWPFLAGPARGGGLGRDQWLVVWPNAALCGWLLLASALAVITVLTAQGDIPSAQRATWALSTIGLVTVAAAAVALRGKTALLLAPGVWGLVAVAVAEPSRQGVVAGGALVAALVLAVVAAVVLLRARRHRRADVSPPVVVNPVQQQRQAGV